MSSERLYGLIGHPLSHSFSKKYFTEKFEKEDILNCSYELFDLETIDELKLILKQNQNLQGFNITIPYKQKIFPFLDDIEDNARKIGAVNVVKIVGSVLKGYNSDYYGFRSSLEKWVGNKPLTGALILGTGGASKAIKCALEDLNIPVQYVSRNAGENNITYTDLKADNSILNSNNLIVNCTPLGTFPNTDACPDIPYENLTESHFLYDLVYNPEQTTFMKKGLANSAKVKNGYDMLVLQAEKSWEIWNG
ncbi:MAG: shikimate dehydrogenase [bacterium]|nr:shikimate dehydrogenase [bacterium]